MKNTPFRSVATALITFGAPGLLLAQTTWDAGGADTNWSTFGNWSTDATPAATAVVFGGTTVGMLGVTTNATTVGNVLDGNVTVDSLTYNNTGAGWQVTQIASGQTLTIDAGTAPSISLLVGGDSSSAAITTNAAITGAGSLVINESTANITVSNSANNSSRANLDMSGLGSFTATVNSVNIGTGTRGHGSILLGANNTITAATLVTGGGTSSVTSSLVTANLTLGQANVLNIDSLKIGTGFTSARMQFKAGSPTATLKIRAQDTTGAANLSIGELGAFTMDGTHSTIVDLTGGQQVDAKINNLVIGSTNGTSLRVNYSASLLVGGADTVFEATTVVLGQVSAGNATANIGTMTGNLTVSAGNFTAGTVTLASSSAASVRNATGNLTVSGGTVSVAGDVTTGIRTGGTGALTSTVSVSGGTLAIGGNLAEGAVTGGSGSMTSTVNLSGGTLDMTRGNISVDTFNFTGGTLKNVASFTGNLNAQNSATLGFDNVDGSFTATTLAGSLTLGASSNLSLSLANGFTPVSGFMLIDNDGTGDSIAGTFATVNGVAFDGGNSFNLTNNTGTYNFTLNYAGGDGNDLVATLNAVPEPSTYAVLAGVLTLGFSVWRRRR